MKLDIWFDQLWADYVDMAPNVSRIRDLLRARGEEVVNDHIAFRTFDFDEMNLQTLGAIVEGLGYTRLEDYRFEAKRVEATAYVCPGKPRIFLSQLQTERFDADTRAILEGLVEQVEIWPSGPGMLLAGRPWRISTEEYKRLAEVSEYASWVAAIGLRPNHFTVFVNALKTLDGLPALLEFVEQEGFALNTAGGRIKGSPRLFLEQSATLADRKAVAFSDGELEIPTCYFEFALRHTTLDGELYDGFVEGNADKIFESTYETKQ